MNIDKVLQSQLDVAISGLTHVRDRILEIKHGDTLEIGRQIESVAFHLEDIQHNWYSLVQSNAAQRPTSPPNLEAS
jgi:hypothetical protein